MLNFQLKLSANKYVEVNWHIHKFVCLPPVRARHHTTTRLHFGLPNKASGPKSLSSQRPNHCPVPQLLVPLVLVTLAVSKKIKDTRHQLQNQTNPSSLYANYASACATEHTEMVCEAVTPRRTQRPMAPHVMSASPERRRLAKQRSTYSRTSKKLCKI